MITVDVIKCAYRQSKEGFVISFVIHPQDKHPELSDAPIGSQWQLQLVPLDEHGNSPDAGSDALAREAGSNNGDVTGPASRLTKQAGMCCKDPRFWAFLTENDMPVIGAESAALAVRFICHVESRKEFIPGTAAGDRWGALYDKFILWRDAPEMYGND